jgi:hypothetical protein
MDILNNIMIFGTSNSANYGLGGKFEANIARWMSNPGTLVLDVIKAVGKAVKEVFKFIEDGAKKALKMLDDMIKPPEKEDTRTDKEKEEDLLKENEERKKRNEKNINGVKNTLIKFFKNLLASAYATISKYKIEIMGIANSLSGSPSTPWHITLGNPLRPFFSSGDMYLSQDVTIKFGPVLAFNDLPSSIKVSFTLQNARPLGMQEILAKFNMGSLRTVNVKKDFIEKDLPTNDGKKKKEEVEKEVIASLMQTGETYFDGIFDKDSQLINPPPVNNNTTGLSPSAQSKSDETRFGSEYVLTGGSTYSLMLLGITTNLESEPNGPVTTLVIGTSSDGGTPSVTESVSTLKDPGESVILLDNMNSVPDLNSNNPNLIIWQTNSQMQPPGQ